MRYTVKELLDWGKSYSYPQLVLSQSDYVKHGEASWRRMARNKDRRKLAWQRIHAWNELTQKRSA